MLTVREREILDALGQGLRDKEIAAQLGISIETVRTHVRNAIRTLGAHTREQAVALLSRRQ
jgi:DNA-binding CsgD family transcriptional regulator